MQVWETLDLAKNQRRTGPMLGIECEIEGKRLPMMQTQVWRSEIDGSLRDGMEYITCPLEPKGVVEALNGLFTYITDNGGKIEYSFRCSTHVHVNVQDLTEEQLMSMIFLYMMYENVFMNYVSDERVGNRFCLRFQDAQQLTYEVSRMFSRIREAGLRHAVLSLRQNDLKYAAMNMYTLRKYGTLEFRALEGTNDPERINTWVNAIVRLRSTAMKFASPEEAYNTFMDNPTALANKIFGHCPDKFLLPGWHQQVEEGYSQNLAVLMTLREPVQQ